MGGEGQRGQRAQSTVTLTFIVWYNSLCIRSFYLFIWSQSPSSSHTHLHPTAAGAEPHSCAEARAAAGGGFIRCIAGSGVFFF